MIAKALAFLGLFAALLGMSPIAAAGEPRHESPGRAEPGREIRVGVESGDVRGADNRVLQEAVDRMASLGGGTVRIGPGRYLMRNALMLRNNVRVIGSPGGTVLVACDGAKTRLVQDASSDPPHIVLEDPAAFRVGDGVAICDRRSPCSFAVTTATLTERMGPRTFRLSQKPVASYTVAQGATAAIAFPVVGGWNIRDAAVEGFTIDGNRPKAQPLDGCRGAGIYLYACQRVAVRRSTVRNCRNDGISFQWGSQDVTIEDCTVEDCLVFGLHPGSDSHHCVVRQNRSTGNGGPGLFVCVNVKHVLFEKNFFCGNQGPGISIGCRDTDNLFRENTIRGNEKTGILFRDDGGEPNAAHRNVFEKNTILDNGAREDKGRPPACVTVLGVHRGLVFRENTLGNTRPGGPASVGFLVVGGAEDLVNQANRFLNLPSAASKK